MDLKKFITESLYQIAGGIRAAQERVAEYNCKIESAPADLGTYEMDDDYHDIFFDVALTVIEEETNPSSSQLLVMGLSHFISGSYENILPYVSRIKFSVPMSYPPRWKEKYPSFLHLGVH